METIKVLLLIITLGYTVSLIYRSLKIRGEPRVNVIIDQKLGEFRAKNFDSDSERDKAKQQLKLELVEIMRSSCINSHSRVKRIWIKQNEALLPDIMQKRIDATSN